MRYDVIKTRCDISRHTGGRAVQPVAVHRARQVLQQDVLHEPVHQSGKGGPGQTTGTCQRIWHSSLLRLPSIRVRLVFETHSDGSGSSLRYSRPLSKLCAWLTSYCYVVVRLRPLSRRMRLVPAWLGLAGLGWAGLGLALLRCGVFYGGSAWSLSELLRCL